MNIVGKECGILVTSYGMLQQEAELIGGVDWFFVVLDEGHKIKNPGIVTTTISKSLRATNRIIITGTPFQNEIIELWSLFDFACPGILGDQNTFEKNFCSIISKGGYATATSDEVYIYIYIYRSKEHIDAHVY